MTMDLIANTILLFFIYRSDKTAKEVYVTGTFDNWGRTVKLDRTEDGFRKDVEVPAISTKMLYKFVVDGAWKIDSAALQEDDGHNNTNNVLLRQHIKQLPPPAKDTPEPDTVGGIEAPAAMSGVTPHSTTAALAADVSKESHKAPETDAAPSVPITSSACPESTTANLAKDVPLERKAESTTGTFPETPSKEPEQFSVNPIPASEGIGNPVHIKPGEHVPNPSTFSKNTITSTATTDKAGYEKDASAPSFLPLQDDETVTTHPVTINGSNRSVEPFIQTASPTSTTAALAGAIPLEITRAPNGSVSKGPESPAKEVPEVVKESMSKAHKEPEAAGDSDCVAEKAEVERQLLESVNPTDASGGVPPMVRRSIDLAHADPEATAVPEAVAEKEEVERQLLREVKHDDSAGEHAPVITAETSPTAPGTTPLAAKKYQEQSISPKSREPAPAPADKDATAQPVVTIGPETVTAPAVSQAQPPAQLPAHPQPQPEGQAEAAAKDADKGKKKKKNRASAIFSKLKEKFK
ncbi:hypothetical protein PAAG_07886 [Paracoccidioides lutzii Pb01]|uniref:AMP-activated protein kinase glycogen-binding domain-containing protein n=1 Tax=Paracoccidioides lutzii (strain ATCC MYA-826 / Pb01) TaxID=502779 RepID=C1HAQ7_PARBA|nr:hypothetical protein PAAG_07886 [Paracoccidioides lutzii Pb01]EEH37468.2 hypothetical protein PAAG_07886 [Paracoccidioides lutzii Pb01]